MLRLLVIFIVSAIAAAAVPVAYRANPQAFGSFFSGAPKPDAAVEAVTPAVRTMSAQSQPAKPLGRKVRIEADQRGHFVADFKLNGRRVTAMVDTGATLVAINASTARRIGLPVGTADFVHEVSTANGRARAAVGLIRELQVGKVVVNDVEAVVLEDGALSETLIGMSFLKRLSKFAVEGNALMLTQ